jgi:hypothetical protein
MDIIIANHNIILGHTKASSTYNPAKNGDQTQNAQSSIWNDKIQGTGSGSVSFDCSIRVWRNTVPDVKPTEQLHDRDPISYVDGIYLARMWNGNGNIEL